MGDQLEEELETQATTTYQTLSSASLISSTSTCKVTLMSGFSFNARYGNGYTVRRVTTSSLSFTKKLEIFSQKA